MRQPCVVDLASVRYEAEDRSEAGYALALAGDHLVVGAADGYDDYGNATTQVLALSLPDLQPLGSWSGGYFAGGALAAADLDGDGQVELAIGGRDGVNLVSGRVEGDKLLEEAALLTLVASDRQELGSHVRFSSDGTEILANGFNRGPGDGRLVVYSTSERGVRDERDALRVITSPRAMNALSLWDGDGDGLDDLSIGHGQPHALSFFQGPWHSGDLGSADLRWSSSSTLGPAFEELGDLTGDGGVDLGLSAPEYQLPQERAGRVYVLEGIGEGGDVADIPLQVHGEKAGDGLGYALAGADLDGDGQQDLVVSASGYSQRPDTLLVYRGPLQLVAHTMDDADAVVRSQYAHDRFARSLAVLDLDSDGRDDLAAGAPGWPAGEFEGAVYLLTGAALLP